MPFFKLQPARIVANFHWPVWILTMADAGMITAKILISMAVVLLVSIQITSWWILPTWTRHA